MKIEGPIKKYTSGAYPTHSSVKKLSENFKDIDNTQLFKLLQLGDYMNDTYKSTQKAKDENVVDSCEGKILWSLDKIIEILGNEGVKLERVPVNQVLPKNNSMEVRWANLGTIGSYFNVTANKVGSWLDDLDLREEDKNPTEESVKAGLAQFVEMSAGPGKKTRRIAQWNLDLICEMLVDNGKVLDFNYEDNLKGRGKNSDVEVSGIDKRAIELYNEWKELYKNPDTHDKAWSVFNNQPKAVIVKVEALFKKPGLISKKLYKNFR